MITIHSITAAEGLRWRQNPHEIIEEPGYALPNLLEGVVAKGSKGALRFREAELVEGSIDLSCGVESPELSQVVASVRDSARLGGSIGFFGTSAAAASNAWSFIASSYCWSYCRAMFSQNSRDPGCSA